MVRMKEIVPNPYFLDLRERGQLNPSRSGGDRRDFARAVVGDFFRENRSRSELQKFPPKTGSSRATPCFLIEIVSKMKGKAALREHGNEETP